MMGKVELFAKTGCILGEGPVWHPATQRISLVDVKANAVLVFDQQGQLFRKRIFAEPISACLPASKGHSVCFLKSGPVLVDLETCPDQVTSADMLPLPNPESEKLDNRYNDAKIGPDGGLWFGSMDDGESEASGALYHMRPDGTCRAMDDGYVVTNGPTFSPCGKTLYHTNTFERIIYAFDLAEAGNLTNKRVLIRIPDDAGFPDGMTADQNGDLWICHFRGARISRYNANGAWQKDYPMPVSNITSCTFGGPELTDLYITTAKWTLSDTELEQEPMAGDIFRMSTDSQGADTLLFHPDFYQNSN